MDMNRRLTALLCAALGSSALAGRDVGVLTNWNEFAPVFGTNANIIALQQDDPTGPLARGLVQNGKFSVTFDDNLAARLAVPPPRCGTVKSTPGLKVALLMGLAITNNQRYYRISREYKTASGTITDVYIYANLAGKVVGSCTENENSAKYNINLNPGWNVVRLQADTRGSNMLLVNLGSKPIPWAIYR